MAFGTDLQGWPAHKALLGLQEFEINLLETIKKCITLRVKADRDYCNSLSELINVSQKLDVSEFTTPFSKSWKSIVDETQKFVAVLVENLSKLQSSLLEKLQRVIAEKKSLRKHYSDQRNRLDLEFYRLSDQVTKCRLDYEQRLEKLHGYRGKYETMARKAASNPTLNRVDAKFRFHSTFWSGFDEFNSGRVGVRLDESRNKFIESVRRVHLAHNAYVVALCEFNLYQRQYNSTLLPDSLSLQELRLEQSCSKCHTIVTEFASVTNSAAEQYQKMNTNIGNAVATLKPDEEYTQFIRLHRTEPMKFTNQEFQLNLLNQGVGTIDNTNLVLNDVTYDAVKQMSQMYSEELARCRMLSGSRRRELQNLETRTSSSSNADGLNTSVSQEVLRLKRELLELQCNEEKFFNLYNLFQDPVVRLGTARVPSVFRDETIDLSIPHSDNSQTRWYRENSNQSTSASYGPNSTENTDGKDTLSAGAYAQQTLSKLRSSLKKRIRHSRNTSRTDLQAPTSINDLTTNDIQASRSPRPYDNRLHRELLSSVDNMYDDDDDDDDVSVSEAGGVVSGNREGLRMAASSGDLVTSDDSASGSSVNQAGSTDGLEMFVEQEAWYHGLLPREEVERLLMDEGDFVLRVSLERRTGVRQYVLSVRHEGHKHFILQGSHELGWQIEGEVFRSIQQLIRHHQLNRIPLTRKSNALLIRPIEKFDWELMNNNIQLLQKIGSGQFGEVFEGIYKPSGERVAVKTCKEALSEEMKRKFLAEGSILKQYDHVNIVRFIGIAAHSQPVMIVMEYVPGGSLLTYLRRCGSQLSQLSLMLMCKDVAAGMAYLQTKQCIHRDLAARNCLVGEENVVKISDFGMSREEGEYTMSRGQLKQIPIKWTSPEALNYGIYTSASDVWSFGVLVWEVFSEGAMPYPGLTNTQAKERVDEGYRMPLPEGCPYSMYSIMTACWEQEPQDRPQFAEIFSQLQRFCSEMNPSASMNSLPNTPDSIETIAIPTATAVIPKSAILAQRPSDMSPYISSTINRSMVDLNDIGSEARIRPPKPAVLPKSTENLARPSVLSKSTDVASKPLQIPPKPAARQTLGTNAASNYGDIRKYQRTAESEI